MKNQLKKLLNIFTPWGPPNKVETKTGAKT